MLKGFRNVRNLDNRHVQLFCNRSGGQELAIQQINAFYMLNKIIPISGGSFGANLGACLWSQDSGAEGVKSDEYGLETLDMTINNFKEFLLEFHKMV